MNKINVYLAVILLILSAVSIVAIYNLPPKEKEVYMKTTEGFTIKVDTRYIEVNKNDVTCDEEKCYLKRDYSVPMPGDFSNIIIGEMNNGNKIQ